MASSWGSISFNPVRTGMFNSLPGGGDLSVTERHVPYSDTTLIDTGGILADHYKQEVLLTSADMVTMKALLGTIAALTVDDFSYGDAMLIKFDPQGVDLSETFVSVDVEFVLGAVEA